MLHLSTDYVFDGKKQNPYTEEDIVKPLNVYGRTKAEGEQIVLSVCAKAYVIRTAWLFAKSHGQNFYRRILAKAKAGKRLQIVNDQIGSPTTTDELSLFLIKIIENSPPFGIYHCSGNQSLSWYEFAQKNTSRTPTGCYISSRFNTHRRGKSTPIQCLDDNQNHYLMKFAVIVPAHNEEANLPRLFESLQTQKLPDEIVLVDDNSSGQLNYTNGKICKTNTPLFNGCVPYQPKDIDLEQK